MAERSIKSEELLANWCLKGDRKSQKYLYETFSNPIFRLLMRYVRNDNDAQDLLVTGFTKVFEKIGEFEFRGKGSLGKWIRRIMVNEALMFLRSKKESFYLEDFDGRELVDIAKIESDLGAEDIFSLILELPTGYRTVFNMHLIEGYSHKEIASTLGISVSTSKSQLNKARKQLQSKIIKTKTGYELG